MLCVQATLHILHMRKCAKVYIATRYLVFLFFLLFAVKTNVIKVLYN